MTTRILLLFFASFSLSAQKEITLEDIWSFGAYQSYDVPGFNFLKDGESYTKLEGSKIVKYNFRSGVQIEVLYDGDAIIYDYSFSPSEEFILIETNQESIYRRSSKADYHLYDRAKKKLVSISPAGKISNATFSPDESKLAFTRENNLYYKDLLTGKVIQVTDDGEVNAIINGSSDWVYEEEFKITKTFAWSPDNQYLGFLRFDESEVKTFAIEIDKGELYPDHQTFKYPKVGEQNAEVTAHIYHLEEGKIVDVKIEGNNYYLPRINWLPNSKQFIVFKLNRYQNNLQLLLANTVDGSTDLLLEEENKYYISIHDNLTFLDKGKGFLWTSEKDGYNQIFWYDMKGREKQNLTPGEYDVTSFYGVDQENETIYFQAARKNPMEREVYSLNYANNTMIPLADQKGSNSAQFSVNFSSYVLNHSTINQPETFRIFDIEGNVIRILEENGQLKKMQERTKVDSISFFSFLTSDNVELNGWLLKPTNYNPKKKYPVLITLYGGPGSQTVTDSWKENSYWWYQMLAQQGYVVASIDNRGTGARGEAFRKSTYLQLGKYETIDQIEAAKFLGGLEYIDGQRIGVFGWSYGGFLSTSCLLKGNDVFKAAIAVAPVTSWRWYDSVYTERYMRTESENERGYLENSPIYFADKLKGRYLIVHGVADDNVHFQHSREMVNALIRANKQFDSFYYPSRNHGIYGDNASLHLYTMMTNFLYDNL